MLKIINKYNSITLSLILFSCIKIFSAAIITYEKKHLKNRYLKKQLISSVINNDTETTKELIKKGANVDAVCVNGNTALILASDECKYGNRTNAIFEWLINAGADVNVTDKSGRTPLILATICGNIEKVKLLINVMEKNARQKISAKEMAHIDSRDNLGNTALMYAAENCDTEMIELLIKSGADVNSTNKSHWRPIIFAITSLRPDCIQTARLLLAHGTYLNSFKIAGLSPLLLLKLPYEYCQLEKENVTLDLLNKQLVEAVKKEDIITAIKLIKLGANVNATDEYGNTALMYAGDIISKPEIFEILIELGANANNEFGGVSLMRAVSLGFTDVVKLLIKGNVDINIKDKFGKTPLMLAAWHVYEGHREIVKLLLRAGAKTDIVDNQGKTALEIAKQRGHNKPVNMLENEQDRRDTVIKKWIKENLYKKITEATSDILVFDISKLIAQYMTIEYTDLPLEYRLNS